MLEFFIKLKREREREKKKRDRERETGTETETETETERERETGTETETKTKTETREASAICLYINKAPRWARIGQDLLGGLASAEAPQGAICLFINNAEKACVGQGPPEGLFVFLLTLLDRGLRRPRPPGGRALRPSGGPDKEANKEPEDRQTDYLNLSLPRPPCPPGEARVGQLF
jgi:hypothetical protein